MWKIKLRILKFIKNFLNKLGKGSSIPGLIDEKIGTSIFEGLNIQIPVVFVIGTNGKTTTANLISDILGEKGLVVNNRKGANLISGIKTSILDHIQEDGSIDADYMVLEVDEYTLKHAVKIISPDFVVVTNFFRDQLDRYGEIDIVIQEIVEQIKTTSAKVVLNGNDPLLYDYFSKVSNEKIYYGLDKHEKIKLEQDKIVEIKYCPECKHIIGYDYYHYGHIGSFACPNCDFKMPQINGLVKVSFEDEMLSFNDVKLSYVDKLPTYFFFNIAAALTVVNELNVDVKTVDKLLDKFEKPTGRSQTYVKGDTELYFNLAKNVVGMEETLDYMKQQYDDKFDLLICFNDNYADGLDVSWIWDADMSVIFSKVNKLYIVGSRRYDMALRFEYEGFKDIIVHDDFDKGVKMFLDSDIKHKAIVSNYTPLVRVSDLVQEWYESTEK